MKAVENVLISHSQPLLWVMINPEMCRLCSITR